MYSSGQGEVSSSSSNLVSKLVSAWFLQLDITLLNCEYMLMKKLKSVNEILLYHLSLQLVNPSDIIYIVFIQCFDIIRLGWT